MVCSVFFRFNLISERAKRANALEAPLWGRRGGTPLGVP